jgi:class 3 adenylate cyclase
VGRLWEGPLSGERVERRLEAILAADVAGYSRLMGADEPVASLGRAYFASTSRHCGR